MLDAEAASAAGNGRIDAGPAVLITFCRLGGHLSIKVR